MYICEYLHVCLYIMCMFEVLAGQETVLESMELE